MGSLLFYKATRKLMEPIEQIKQSIKEMENGQYPYVIQNFSEDEVGQLVTHFNHLTLKLQENEDMRYRMLSDMSHEIRTPLSNLKGYLEALNKGVITGDSTLYSLLSDEAERITALFSQIDSIKEWDNTRERSLKPRKYAAIDELIIHVSRLFTMEFQQANIQFEVKTDPGNLLINQEGIKQVITNLLSNALQYYQGNEIVKLRGENNSDYYLISVQGPGDSIPESEHEKIFERFYRTDPSRTRKTGGSGLGLAISKDIVAQHNGTLKLKSNGHIHTFIVAIPHESTHETR